VIRAEHLVRIGTALLSELAEARPHGREGAIDGARNRVVE
jgi:hypothetical protein